MATTDREIQTSDQLREFLLARRWFRSKARKVSGSSIRDSIPVPGTASTAILLDVRFAEGDTDTYLLTMADQESSADALENPAFAQALLNAIAAEETLAGQHGRLVACHTSAFERLRGDPHQHLPSKVSKAEQSNSSVLYGDRLILKLFRKLEPGVNPDYEIGRFLTEHGFKNTPAVAGNIEYKTAASPPMSVAILQQFVPNRGDAWDYTLEQAAAFFDRIRENTQRPQLPATQHPMELMHLQPPSLAAKLISDYLESARLLGQRTAEMHITLGAGQGNPEFQAEPFTAEFREEMHKGLLVQADKTLSVVRDKLPALTGPVGSDARALLELEPRIRDAFEQVCKQEIHALRIRHHGDYHLGQVLYTGDDFMIIDFEGEPARSLEERRAKRAAMRDVAGMLRSFQYAAFSALRKREAQTEHDEEWAAYWTAWVGREFLAAYFEKASGHPFLPENENERKLLLDVFLLEKALYEVAYELNNRPDWVAIPLRGIATVMN